MQKLLKGMPEKRRCKAPEASGRKLFVLDINQNVLVVKIVARKHRGPKKFWRERTYEKQVHRRHSTT